ncbi:hypothetical protein EXU30_11565 [Shewanella maritima]|uniref:Uncharacterized protein n=1 Tax=Shewanella maritima TaxID=2520507 RepID=A0A411PIG6_9GAMM|nr:hypothetical protein [Shewanella maritima]QBF83264.1 hypothetical protein EXU30_11565 [Shewanella maritima]
MKQLLATIISALVCVASLAGTPAAANTLTAYQSLPNGWRTEVIPFPLDFAPNIELEGVEELVFAPGMYDATKQDFFSYAFVWAIKPQALEQTRMHDELHRYYLGLYQAVSGQKQASTNSVKISFSVYESDNRYHGHIDWIEPFVTNKPQRVLFEAHKLECRDKEETRWYFVASPQEKDHQIWQQLRGLKTTKC